jgi:hypothetical protein
VSDCPNCSFAVAEGVRICPNCGFDTGESQAEDVRALREEGRIHPGRLGAADRNDFAGASSGERPPPHEELPAEDADPPGPEQLESGM